MFDDDSKEAKEMLLKYKEEIIPVFFKTIIKVLWEGNSIIK